MRNVADPSLVSTQLYRKFRPDQTPPAELGRDRDYAVDLIPKFIIASGELTRILVHTDVTRYLEFKQIAGSFVYRDGKISKVPSTEMEAVKSPLMGLFEKRRAKKFFEFLQNWKDEDPATHQGASPSMLSAFSPLSKSTSRHRPGQGHYGSGVREVWS